MKATLITASQLTRYCGYARVLGKKRKRTRSQLAAMAKGDAFHLAAAHTITAGPGDVTDVADPEVFEWLRVFLLNWQRRSVDVELAVGISPTGRHVPVTEPEPHKYVAADARATLLTAGRADIAWLEEPSTAVVLDLKTGKHPPEHPDTNLQLWSLGLAYADMVGAERLRVGLYFARNGTTEWSGTIPLDSEEAAQRWADVEHAARLDETPRVGPWCETCWERRGCEPYQQQAAA
ncbi:MAG TPA: hypothetical protein VEA41_09095 [Salinarimonas sp.]|nr:hypothetical protein [Salinarimonas sp.]